MADDKDKKADAPKVETKPYVLKAGYAHEGAATGQTVELTEAQARAFKDKFQTAEEAKAEAKAKVKKDPVGPSPDGEGSGAGAVGPTHVPQDIGAQTMVNDTNMGNQMPIAGNFGSSGALSPGSSAANTSAATGSPLSPPPGPDVVVGGTVAGPPKEEKAATPAKDDHKSKK